MKFFKLDNVLDHPVFFLDLNYTTQEDGETWHWFLCLNNGSKQQIKSNQLNSFERIDYNDIDQSQITETQ